MGYWFENPRLKALAPLALSTSIKGLTTIFNTPKMFIGSNVFDGEEVTFFLTFAGG